MTSYIYLSQAKDHHNRKFIIITLPTLLFDVFPKKFNMSSKYVLIELKSAVLSIDTLHQEGRDFQLSRSSSRWDSNFHSYVLTVYVRLY